MKIISASRRTDIPAFYGNWLMNRLSSGFAGYMNPFNGKRYLVSMKREDIAVIALWSKNFEPFLEHLLFLKKENYQLFLNYTITGLPVIFEPGIPPLYESIEIIKYLSQLFSPDQINWRYDPIIISDITGFDYHLDQFNSICKALNNSVKRCFISFPTLYGKVERSFKRVTESTGIILPVPDIKQNILLAVKLSEIAGNYGIALYSCCSDYLNDSQIKKGHCIDGDLLPKLSGKDLTKLIIKPSRKGCGCTESIDIGLYNSCPHNCIYCYANYDTVQTTAFYAKYISDPSFEESSFLGINKNKADEWVKEINENEMGRKVIIPFQPLLFND